MDFKLNEEQSNELLNHFGNYKSIIELVNSTAYDLLEKYYQIYKINKKNYWFKPMNKTKFLEKICKGTGCISVDNNIKSVYSYNIVNTRLNLKYMRKLGIIVEPIAHNIIDAAIDSHSSTGDVVKKYQDIYDMLMEYSSPPFIVDDRIINIFKYIKKQNLFNIEVLNNFGIEYEL